jgi:hypothetical protein
MKELEARTSTLWSDYLEWTLSAAVDRDDPFTVDARAVFTHDPSGEQISTGIFFMGGDNWSFRFANSRIGSWSCETFSDIDALNGWHTRIEVDPGTSPHGTLTHINHWWTWSESGEVIVPQLVMYGSPDTFRNQPEKIDRDIETFFGGHGFNGFHVPVFCRWLDIHKESHPEFEEPDPVPDVRTFEALELLIQKTRAAGGIVHLWLWGDNDAGHQMTPMRDDWGGKQGRVAQRLYRYIAARLGPVTGWSMGYGFDLEHWVDEADLRTWHEIMSTHMGWPHPLGGRSGRPKDATELEQIFDGLDYAGYTHHRPVYEDYRAVVRAHPDKPVFSEDRFRIRVPSRFSFKDYDEVATRKGLWHSTMAGGVANIWGKMAEGESNGESVPFPNMEQILAAARFFQGRLSARMEVVDEVLDGVCLMDQNEGTFIFYKEDTDTLRIELPNAGSYESIVVDACSPYAETTTHVKAGNQTLQFPRKSDWGIAISRI